MLLFYVIRVSPILEESESLNGVQRRRMETETQKEVAQQWLCSNLWLSWKHKTEHLESKGSDHRAAVSHQGSVAVHTTALHCSADTSLNFVSFCTQQQT